MAACKLGAMPRPATLHGWYVISLRPLGQHAGVRARLGDAAITCLAPLEDHRPERAWREDVPAPATRDIAAPAAQRVQCVLPGAPRPVWLLSEPQPLAATFEARPWILRDGPPVAAVHAELERARF